MIIKPAFLDTNVIDFCIEKGLSGKRFCEILSKRSLFSAIGPWTIYEHARCYKEKLDKMKHNFAFIADLNPIFLPLVLLQFNGHEERRYREYSEPGEVSCEENLIRNLKSTRCV